MSSMQETRHIYLKAILIYIAFGVSMTWASNKAVRNLIDKGDYSGAYNLLLEENSKTPDDAETLYLLGICAESGNMASLYLKDYLQKYPDGEHAPEARRLLMDYYSSAGLLITAGSLLENTASERSPKPHTLYNSALYKQQLGQYDQAIDLFRKVRNVADDEYKLWAELGISDCRLSQDKPESALSGYKDLAENYPNSKVFPFALVGISEAYRRMGNIDKSKVFYDLYREKYEMAPRNIEIEAALFENQNDDNDRELRSLIDIEYYVQVGVFARKSNASTCMKKFRNMRYSARMSDFRDSGRTFYRVLVGPYQDQAEAQREKSKLEKSQAEKYTIYVQ
jgi:tetratricopeptide (TPR) repeat protein